MKRFKKEYSDVHAEKILGFFKNRLSEESVILNTVWEILREIDKDKSDSVLYHLNEFIKWYVKYYESLPSKEMKQQYIGYVCNKWREENKRKWQRLSLPEHVITHLSCLLLALFTEERRKLFNVF